MQRLRICIVQAERIGHLLAVDPQLILSYFIFPRNLKVGGLLPVNGGMNALFKG